MTDITSAAPPDEPVLSTAPDASTEDPSLAGLLHTVDHKRLGRAFLLLALLVGCCALVADMLVRFDLASDSSSPVLGVDAFAQTFALSRELLVLGFAIPAFLGVALYVVPLQVGASNIAFPRAAAVSFWGWLVSIGVLLGAYLGNGGPYGGWSDGVDLHLLAVSGAVVSLLAGAICVATTVLTMRAPGMYLDRTPPFAWSAMVTASMLVVTLPVLLGQIVILYIDHRYGRVFLDGNYGIWPRLDWAYRAPMLFVYVVPVLGTVAEVLLAQARRWVFEPLALYFTLGLVGLFGFGAWANFGIASEGSDLVDGSEGIVLVGLYAGAFAGALGLLGLLGFTILQSRVWPKPTTAVLAALVAGQLVAFGAFAGFIGAVVDWLGLAGRGSDGNAPLRLTTWVTAQQTVLVHGAVLLGLLAAVHWWAPKIWGRRLNEWTGRGAFLLMGAGTFLAWLGPAISGAATEQPQFFYGDPARTTQYEGLTDTSGAEGLSALGAVGVAIVLVGAALMLANLVVSVLMRRGAVAEADPWGGLTPEWLLASPPPLGASAQLQQLSSGTPLLDATTGGVNGSANGDDTVADGEERAALAGVGSQGKQMVSS